MKIGFSYGRCIRDIVEGLVNADDVAFIITGTAVRDEDHMLAVIEDYLLRRDYLAGLDPEKCKEVALDLWRSKKVLQPRLQGIHRHKMPENAVWVDMFPTVPSVNDSVRRAWDSYRLMLHMVEHVDNEAFDAFK